LAQAVSAATRRAPARPGAPSPDGMLKASQGEPAPFDGSLLSLVAWLRWADTRVPVSASLSVTGVSLVLLGAACGCYTIISQNPWVASLLAGLACLAVAAVAHHGGLVTFLPLSAQDSLLRMTPFDFLFDDASFINLYRRWGRLLLLCQQRSECEIQTILRGMDSEFLDRVFRRGIVHMLPSGFRLLLLPNLVQPAEEEAPPQRRPRAQGPPWWLGGLGPLVAKFAQGPCEGSCGEVRRVELTPAGIRGLLAQLAEEKQRSVTEPALGPVVFQLLVPLSLAQQLRSMAAHRSLQLAAVAAASSAGACAASGMLLRAGSAQSILRAVAFGGRAGEGGSQRAGHVAAIATGLGLFGVGASLALAAGLRRCLLPGPAAQALKEPEIEASPENSSPEASSVAEEPAAL